MRNIVFLDDSLSFAAYFTISVYPAEECRYQNSTKPCKLLRKKGEPLSNT